MKVQKIYEDALSMVGKTEEGTSYALVDRAPALLNPDITVLNHFRDEDDQIPAVTKISDEIELTAREAQGLTLCLACVIAEENTDIPENRLAALMRQRAQTIGTITSGMEDVVEAIRVD